MDGHERKTSSNPIIDLATFEGQAGTFPSHTAANGVDLFLKGGNSSSIRRGHHQSCSEAPSGSGRHPRV